MLGRRSHARVSIAAGAEGVLSLARDVAMGSVDEDGQLVAISREPGVLGETVTVAVPDEAANVSVEVVASKPFISDGAVRHRLLLRRLNVTGNATPSNRIDQGR